MMGDIRHEKKTGVLFRVFFEDEKGVPQLYSGDDFP